MPKTVKAWALHLKFRRHGKREWYYWHVNNSKSMAHRELRSSIWIIDQARAANLTNCAVKQSKGEIVGSFGTPGADWSFRIYPVDAEKF